jgi:predicted nucleic acid-binding protein
VTAWLLDTNVLSEVIKKRPSERVMTRLRDEPASSLYTSSVCVMEMRYGAARVPDGAKLWARIESEVLSRVKVLPFGDEEGALAGELLADLEKRGAQIGVEDILIGATALARGLSVSTRNVDHLARIDGLTVENWFDEPASKPRRRRSGRPSVRP